jgi:hypothetical protein
MRKNLLKACFAIMLVGVIAIGMGQIIAKKPGGGSSPCPSPAPGMFCPLYYAPVVCGPNDCFYSNQCFASLAGWKTNQCDAVGPGPIPVEY